MSSATAPKTLKASGGFTLLEVMVAIAILAIGLSAVFSAEAGAVRTAQRARKMSVATLLVRCKMGEIEEELAKKGLPAVFASGSDNCCEDAEMEGFKCDWEIQPVVLPDTMFAPEDDEGEGGGKQTAGPELSNASKNLSNASKNLSKGTASSTGLTSMIGAAAAALTGNKETGDDKSKQGDDKSKQGDDKDKGGPPTKDDVKDLMSGDPTRFLSEKGGGDLDAITAMALQFVYPALKPSFESQIRRATVTVSWFEGDAKKSFDVTQYVVAEQPVPLATDPNDPNALGAWGPNGATGTGSTGTGTGSTGLSP